LINHKAWATQVSKIRKIKIKNFQKNQRFKKKESKKSKFFKIKNFQKKSNFFKKNQNFSKKISKNKFF
jgi:hypothetical protein